jgi:ligand-binding SRPBCC domain-containing protein
LTYPQTNARTVVPVIELTTEVRSPLERAFDLSRSVELHMASTAQTGERAVAGVTSGLMTLGQEVTWRARHFGVWQHLTSRITAFEGPVHFRDSQVRGAFHHFDHDHFFAQRGEITIMRDVFDFQSPFGILGRIADRLFLTEYMRRFLLTRNALIKSVAETEEWRRYLKV